MYEQLLNAIRMHSEMDDAQITEASRCGADAEWPGFRYTSDCVTFYRANEQAIWELLEETADQMGVQPFEFVANFGRADMAADFAGFTNLLAWFALEEVGQWLSDRATVDPETRPDNNELP